MNASRIITRLCALAVVIVAGVLPAMAADFMVDSICYNIIGENEVEVTFRDVKYTGDVIIPATIINDGVEYQVTHIGKQAFSSCNKITSVEIPEGVTHIGYQAFSFCTLRYIDFPNSLVSIGERAFTYCSKITGFYFPRNVAEIGEGAFSGCDALTDFMCSGANTHFKAVNGVLYSKDMTKLYAYPVGMEGTSFDIPSSVTDIMSFAFYGCNLVSVNIPESVIWIGDAVFAHCDRLETLDYPDGITHIGFSGFFNCDRLTSVHLPANLDTIHMSMGANTKVLTEIFIPRTVRYIDEMAFFESKIKTFTFEEGSQLDGIGLRAFDSTPIEYFDMPNTVTKMDAQVFGNCKELKQIHLSDNLQQMGISSLRSCTSLIECEIPGGVVAIKNVCVDCPSLKKLKFGNKNSAPGVTTLQRVTIARCEQLEYIELGANVDSLENSALDDVDSLKVLICWAAVPPRCNDYWGCFYPSSVYRNVPLYVPEASLEAYKTAPEWNKFTTIVPIERVGDVDGNGIVGITDVTELIDLLLNGGDQYPALADVDLDGKVSITDVTELIDRILNGSQD